MARKLMILVLIFIIFISGCIGSPPKPNITMLCQLGANQIVAGSSTSFLIRVTNNDPKVYNNVALTYFTASNIQFYQKGTLKNPPYLDTLTLNGLESQTLAYDIKGILQQGQFEGNYQITVNVLVDNTTIDSCAQQLKIVAS